MSPGLGLDCLRRAKDRMFEGADCKDRRRSLRRFHKRCRVHVCKCDQYPSHWQSASQDIPEAPSGAFAPASQCNISSFHQIVNNLRAAMRLGLRISDHVQPSINICCWALRRVLRLSLISINIQPKLASAGQPFGIQSRASIQPTCDCAFGLHLPTYTQLDRHSPQIPPVTMPRV